jgi:hypothetical protein
MREKAWSLSQLYPYTPHIAWCLADVARQSLRYLDL